MKVILLSYAKTKVLVSELSRPVEDSKQFTAPKFRNIRNVEARSRSYQFSELCYKISPLNKYAPGKYHAFSHENYDELNGWIYQNINALLWEESVRFRRFLKSAKRSFNEEYQVVIFIEE